MADRSNSSARSDSRRYRDYGSTPSSGGQPHYQLPGHHGENGSTRSNRRRHFNRYYDSSQSSSTPRAAAPYYNASSEAQYYPSYDFRGGSTASDRVTYQSPDWVEQSSASEDSRPTVRRPDYSPAVGSKKPRTEMSVNDGHREVSALNDRLSRAHDTQSLEDICSEALVLKQDVDKIEGQSTMSLWNGKSAVGWMKEDLDEIIRQARKRAMT